MALRLESCTVDLKRRRVERAGMVSTLMPKEADLLSYLVEHTNEIVSREDLLRDVWGYDRYIDTRTVDTHMRRLRAKLGATAVLLQTVRGVGYRFTDEEF